MCSVRGSNSDSNADANADANADEDVPFEELGYNNETFEICIYQASEV